MLIAQLKSFFMVARIGSVTQAAKRLGLSQPTITAQIRALEEAYGVELFHRGGRRLALSDAGLTLLPKVETLVQQETEIDFFLRHSGDLRTGSLRIGATAPYYVLDLIRRFSARYPAIDVTVEMGNSQEMLNALQEYRVDVAMSSNFVDDPRLSRLLLGVDPLVLVVHRTHPLAGRTEITPAALAGCRLLMREAGSTTRIATEQMLAEANVVPGSQMEIGSRESIREAVVRNLGVSVIALHEVPSHADLRVLHFTGGSPQLHEYMYCLRERRQARLIDAFVSLAEPAGKRTED
ncbi:MULTISPECIES: LysR family transcriptional regulator [Cupriavidus]|uniref:Transcriptional regulator, LysR family n=1 Tax=Cupriavidus pinatubonensis (strain JMP 134 / LMG 1197) TaxID=264198 RepID=Q46PS1_CUPPJ|nr:MULTISPECIES: LysR family transcriptional regulator [Cupriavidus]QYY29731.1 LysR family transcriptional regulator [Cupriavidus pinatubonensis]TPQ37337.1 LysR family transcriptional regulator [Cupriavidus pinatubonensis]